MQTRIIDERCSTRDTRRGHGDLSRGREREIDELIAEPGNIVLSQKAEDDHARAETFAQQQDRERNI
jgi:hypothetical protein